MPYHGTNTWRTPLLTLLLFLLHSPIFYRCKSKSKAKCSMSMFFAFWISYSDRINESLLMVCQSVHMSFHASHAECCHACFSWLESYISNWFCTVYEFVRPLKMNENATFDVSIYFSSLYINCSCADLDIISRAHWSVSPDKFFGHINYGISENLSFYFQSGPISSMQIACKLCIHVKYGTRTVCVPIIFQDVLVMCLSMNNKLHWRMKKKIKWKLWSL